MKKKIEQLLITLKFKGMLRIPTNPDTHSSPFRTPIPIESGHLFQSKADTPESERSDAGKSVNMIYADFYSTGKFAHTQEVFPNSILRVIIDSIHL